MEIENEINDKLNNNLNKEINNEIEITNKQKSFLNNIIGQTITNAVDIGLRAILPDLIENQIIDIKNSLLKNGLKEGINTAINEAIDLGKSAKGIFTGKFENMKQVKTAIGDGGIVDTISELINKASNRAYELGYINKTVNTVIKNGKNVLLDNISNNIKNELEEQTNATEKLEKYIDNWKECYKNKDFEGMEKEIDKIKEAMEKVVPLENILKESRRVENIHNLISKKENKFEISDLEKDVINKFE